MTACSTKRRSKRQRKTLGARICQPTICADSPERKMLPLPRELRTWPTLVTRQLRLRRGLSVPTTDAMLRLTSGLYRLPATHGRRDLVATCGNALPLFTAGQVVAG